jgi:hypothetical protein
MGKHRGREGVSLCDPFLAQSGSLGHPKAMLLIYDSQTQVPELHPLLDQSVGTDEDVHVSGSNLLMDLLFF